MTLTETAPQRSRRVGGLLRQPYFRMLWIGETVSRFGTVISGIVIPLIAVQTLGAGTFMVGLLEAVAWLPWLIIGLPAGALADRLPRRPTMLVCDLLSALLVLSIPVAAWFDLLTMSQLLVVALLAGTATVFFTTAYQSYLPVVVAREDLAEGNAKLQGSEQVATIAGPGLGGVLAQVAGALLGLVVDAVTFVVSFFCLLRIRVPEPARPPAERVSSLRTEMAEGMRFVMRDPFMRVLTLTGALDNLILVGTHALLIVFLIRDVGVPAGAVGVLITADAVGGVAGAFVATRIARRFGTGRTLLVSGILTAPFALLLPLTEPGPLLACFAVGLFVPAVGMVVGNVVGSSFRQAYVPEAIRGRAFTSTRFLQFGVIPLGALMGGALGEVIGVRETLWLLLCLGVLAKFARLIGPLRHHRDLPTEYPRPAVTTEGEPS